jgi:hypothetical protein
VSGEGEFEDRCDGVVGGDGDLVDESFEKGLACCATLKITTGAAFTVPTKDSGEPDCRIGEARRIVAGFLLG